MAAMNALGKQKKKYNIIKRRNEEESVTVLLRHILWLEKVFYSKFFSLRFLTASIQSVLL